jgi:two-component system response regulator ArlR
MQKVLVVEDDRGIADFVRLELEHEGFSVVSAESGRTALSVYEKEDPDIILLDIMLPELSGLEVLRRIRKISHVPVILVTARDETYDKVNGLDAGADDYIAKPFEIEELLARMRAVMRRAADAQGIPSELRVKNLEINLGKMEVLLEGQPVDLSRTEFLLLKTLVGHKNTVLSRDAIISEVWGSNHYIEENSVDVYVRYLRSKIDEKSNEEYISTVRGSGYIVKDTD